MGFFFFFLVPGELRDCFPQVQKRQSALPPADHHGNCRLAMGMGRGAGDWVPGVAPCTFQHLPLLTPNMAWPFPAILQVAEETNLNSPR